MIDLALLVAMQDADLCVIGEDGNWNTSPIKSDGTTVTEEGLWIFSTAKEPVTRQGLYTDEVTVATRYDSSISQAKKLIQIAQWVKNFNPCILTCGEYIPGQSFNVKQVTPDEGFSLDTVDSEGRFIKSYSFEVQYLIL